jgi:glyoxylase-like metal-dependent hydrolase (beta-lactamase superfamily II)
MKIELIDTGYFYADGGAMFGAVPKAAWQRRYPCNENNGCVLAMRSALISDGEGKFILIDNGAGNKHLRQLSYYKFFGLTDLKEELLRRQVRPEQITDVVLTHLHFDHCGYTTQKDEPEDGNEAGRSLRLAFPDAVHWISRIQWDICRRPNPLEKDSFRFENVEALGQSGKLQLIHTDTDISPSVALRLFGGHTPGQIVPYIRNAERTYVFAGDVIPLSASVSPEWISAYDMYPQTSYYEKLRMLEEAASEGQALIYCHDAYHACSTIKKVKDGFYKTALFINPSTE